MNQCYSESLLGGRENIHLVRMIRRGGIEREFAVAFIKNANEHSYFSIKGEHSTAEKL